MIIDLAKVPVQTTTVYPDRYKHVTAGRIKQKVGEFGGLTNFGVNYVKLPPGCKSSIRHWHLKQDEFVYIVSGQPTLITNEGKLQMTPGQMATFKAGDANGHQLVNESEQEVVYLEVGDKTPYDEVTYPDTNLRALGTDEGWKFIEK